MTHSRLQQSTRMICLAGPNSKECVIKSILKLKLLYYFTVIGLSKPMATPVKKEQVINDLSSWKAASSSIREIKLNDIPLTEQPDLSYAVNDHFSSIGPNTPLSNSNDTCHLEYVKGIDNRFEFRPTNRAFSLIGRKESVCIRKEFNSHRIVLVHQHGHRFIVLEHQYGRRDVMWKRSIVDRF